MTVTAPQPTSNVDGAYTYITFPVRHTSCYIPLESWGYNHRGHFLITPITHILVTGFHLVWTSSWWTWPRLTHVIEKYVIIIMHIREDIVHVIHTGTCAAEDVGGGVMYANNTRASQSHQLQEPVYVLCVCHVLAGCILGYTDLSDLNNHLLEFKKTVAYGDEKEQSQWWWSWSRGCLRNFSLPMSSFHVHQCVVPHVRQGCMTRLYEGCMTRLYEVLQGCMTRLYKAVWQGCRAHWELWL